MFTWACSRYNDIVRRVNNVWIGDTRLVVAFLFNPFVHHTDAVGIREAAVVAVLVRGDPRVPADVVAKGVLVLQQAIARQTING